MKIKHMLSSSVVATVGAIPESKQYIAHDVCNDLVVDPAAEEVPVSVYVLQ